MTALTSATCFGVVCILFLVLTILLYFSAAKGFFESVAETDIYPEHQISNMIRSLFGKMFWVFVSSACFGICFVGFGVSLCFHFFG